MFVSQGQSVPHSHSSEALFKKNKIYPGRGTDENCCGASYCPGLQEADFQKEAEVSEHANVDGPQVRPTAWRLQGSTQVKALSGVWCSPTAPPLSSQKSLSLTAGLSSSLPRKGLDFSGRSRQAPPTSMFTLGHLQGAARAHATRNRMGAHVGMPQHHALGTPTHAHPSSRVFTCIPKEGYARASSRVMSQQYRP